MRRRWLLLALVAAAGLAGCSSAEAGPVAPAAGYQLVNADGFPSDSAALFNLEGPGTRTDLVTHSRVTLRLVPTSAAPVTVEQVSLPAGWTLAAPAALPARATAVAPLALTIRMVAAPQLGLRTGQATVTTDSTVRPTVTVQLAGFAQAAVGGANEPTLQQLFTLFGWSTPTLGTGQRMATRGMAGGLVGAEVAAGTFTAAVAARPVTVREIAAFHRLSADGPLAWRPAAAAEGAEVPLLTQAPLQSQTVLPATDAGRPTVASFTPGGPFALVANGQDTVDARNDPALDRSKWQCMGRCGHHVRVYPVLDAAGHAVADSWLVCVDYNAAAPGSRSVGHEGVNYDYQDAVYLVGNARPVGGA